MNATEALRQAIRLKVSDDTNTLFYWALLANAHENKLRILVKFLSIEMRKRRFVFLSQTVVVVV